MRAARMVWLARLLPAATVVFLGCGGSDGPGSPNPSISIAPPSATTSAGADPTTFTATRTGVAEAASWSLDGPGTLSTTSGDAISYTPPDILDEPATATLTATAGELSAKATITVNPAPSGPPVTVSGTVVDSCLRPMADVVVWIRNRGIGLDPGAGVQPLLLFNFVQTSQGVPADFTVPVPDAPGIQLGIQTEAATDGGDSQSWLRQVSPGGSITLGMDPAPTMVSPSAGAAVDLATQSFTWQSSVGGVQGLFVTILVPTGGGFINWVDYQAFTMGRSFRVPSPTEFGLSAVPAGSRGEWHVGTSNEPTLARLAGTGSPVLLAGGILSVMLPVPESAEVRFATATADGRFTLP